MKLQEKKSETYEESKWILVLQMLILMILLLISAYIG